jgi:rhodanese-related sulfurtransferase
MKKTVVLSLAIVMLVTGLGQVFADGMTGGDFVAEAKANILHVNVSVAKDLYDTGEYVFIDVRREAETRMGYIPGALMVDRGVLEFAIAGAVEDKNAKIVVYCKSGGRSSLATYTLKKMGYTNVISMDGGFNGWTAAEYPIDG